MHYNQPKTNFRVESKFLDNLLYKTVCCLLKAILSAQTY